jgi:hypothetical protein
VAVAGGALVEVNAAVDEHPRNLLVVLCRRASSPLPGPWRAFPRLRRIRLSRVAPIAQDSLVMRRNGTVPDESESVTRRIQVVRSAGSSIARALRVPRRETRVPGAATPRDRKP